MVDQKKPSGFGIGLAIGAVLGGVAAFFLSPKSGPENREMVAAKLKAIEKKLKEAEIPEKLAELSTQASKMYGKVSVELTKKIAELQDDLESVDWNKYKEMVEETVEKVRAEMDIATDEAEKITQYLLKQWDTVLGDTKKEVKFIKKAAKKTIKKVTKK